MSRSFSEGSLTSQIHFKPPLHLLSLLRRRFHNNSDHKFFHRERKTRLFSDELEDSIIIPGKAAEYNTFWVIPILTDNTENLQNYLLKHGIDSTQARHSQTAITHQLDKFSVKTAQNIMEKIVYLPNIVQMKQKDRKKFISLLNSIY